MTLCCMIMMAQTVDAQNMYVADNDGNANVVNVSAVDYATFENKWFVFKNDKIDSIETRSITASFSVTLNTGTEVRFLSATPEIGVCFSHSNTIPTVKDNCKLLGTEFSSYTFTLSSLIPGMTYYYRTYVRLEDAVIYGDIVQVQTLAYKEINGHKFIDLGLPSGLLWAETNIGAETAYDNGNYYAWGETSPKQIYTDSTYTTLGEWGYSDVYEKFALTYTKYNSTDCKYVLENTDDAAYVNWGTSCRMPTQSEWDELTNAENCTWAWINRTNSDGKTIHCYKVVSNKNNQTIYLPASGYRRGNNLYYYGSYGNYWSRDRSKFNSDPYSLKFNNSGAAYSGLNLESLRYYGFTIRSVAEP